MTWAQDPELSVVIPIVWQSIEHRTREIYAEEIAKLFDPYLRSGRFDASIIAGEQKPPMVIMGDGSNVIPTGVKIWWPFDYPFQVEQWSIVADAVGSLAITLTQATFATFGTWTPMSGGGAIALTGTQTGRVSDVSLWTGGGLIAADTIVQVTLDSCATIKKAMLWLSGVRL